MLSQQLHHKLVAFNSDGKLMRDYLYMWRDLEKGRLIASGIEFVDFQKYLKRKSSGVLLLRHQYHNAYYGPRGLDFVPANELSELASDDIYRYGDFCWLDLPGVGCSGATLPEISNQELAEILYFGQRFTPFGDVPIQSIRNEFFAHVHDDGWLLILYTSDWSSVEALTRPLVENQLEECSASKVIELVRSGATACLVKNDGYRQLERSHDIDGLMNAGEF